VTLVHRSIAIHRASGATVVYVLFCPFPLAPSSEQTRLCTTASALRAATAAFSDAITEPRTADGEAAIIARVLAVPTVKMHRSSTQKNGGIITRSMTQMFSYATRTHSLFLREHAGHLA
jgi:hypothetical protein